MTRGSWLLVLPALAAVGLFVWYPNLATLWMALHRWDGGEGREFVGLANFERALLHDPLFWQGFAVIAILFAANLVKLWPSIIAAIVLHRLRSARAQYAYRIALTLPLVIPALVGLLVWKSIFDPTGGALNHLLNASGLMAALDWADRALPALAATLAEPWSPLAWLVRPLFGSALGLALAAVALYLARHGPRRWRERGLLWAILAIAGLVVWGRLGAGGSLGEGLARGGLIVAAALGLAAWWHRRAPLAAAEQLGRLAWWLGGAALVLLLAAETWTKSTGAFANGQPAWLGHSQLVLPAVILWGWPWIGSVGVLIYLAGLSAIPREVYEAARLDGLGSWGIARRIELPLILGHIRLNLVFLTIATLNEYVFFLILLGPSGGPDHAGLTPGLYIYQRAFIGREFGYACALGTVLFALLLVLTIAYQRHLRTRA